MGNLDLTQLAASQNNKYLTINETNDEIDNAITRAFVVLVDDSNAATLAASDFRRNVSFILTEDSPVPTADITLTVPAVSRGLFLVDNNTNQLAIVEISGQSEPSPTINAGDIKLFVTGGSNVFAVTSAGGFIALSDTPLSYSGQADSYVRVNGGETGLDFSSVAPTALMRTHRGAHASLSADLTGQNYTGAGAAVIWNQVQFDTDSFWSGGSPTRLTVPAGVTKVRVGSSIDILNGPDDSGMAIRLGFNGSTSHKFLAEAVVEASGFTQDALSFSSGVIPVIAGNYFEVFVLMETDSSVDVDDARSNFWIEVVESNEVLPGVAVERPHVGVLVYNSINQSLNNGSNTTLTWDTEAYDTGYLGVQFHDTGVNPSRITIPNGVTKIRLTGALRMNDAGATQAFVEFNKNGSGVIGSGSQDAQTTGTDNLSVSSAVLIVSPGDYFELIAFTDGAGNTAAADSGFRTWFAMEVVETSSAAFPPEQIELYLDTAAWDTAAFPTSVPIFKKIATRRFSLEDDLAGSVGQADAGPNGGAVVIDVQRNGSSIGSITFADSSGAAQTATFATAGATVEDFEIGDRLELVAPANWQSMDEIVFSLFAWRS
jgi:hypothetical protein